jgi:hypothetical protein
MSDGLKQINGLEGHIQGYFVVQTPKNVPLLSLKLIIMDLLLPLEYNFHMPKIWCAPNFSK